MGPKLHNEQPNNDKHWFIKYSRQLWTWKSLGSPRKEPDYLTIKDSEMQFNTLKLIKGPTVGVTITQLYANLTKITEIKK